MNWGAVWHIDFADWSIISSCIEVIQTRIKFLSWYPICFNTIIWQIRILLKRQVFTQRVTNRKNLEYAKFTSLKNLYIHSINFHDSDGMRLLVTLHMWRMASYMLAPLFLFLFASSPLICSCHISYHYIAMIFSTLTVYKIRSCTCFYF